MTTATITTTRTPLTIDVVNFLNLDKDMDFATYALAPLANIYIDGLLNGDCVLETTDRLDGWYKSQMMDPQMAYGPEPLELISSLQIQRRVNILNDLHDDINTAVKGAYLPDGCPQAAASAINHLVANPSLNVDVHTFNVMLSDGHDGHVRGIEETLIGRLDTYIVGKRIHRTAEGQYEFVMDILEKPYKV